MEEKNVQIKRLNEARKKVLQYRTDLDALELELGSQEMFKSEWRNTALAHSLLLGPDLRFLLLHESLIDIIAILINSFKDFKQMVREHMEDISIMLQNLSDGLLGEIEIATQKEDEIKEMDEQGETSSYI